MNIPVSSILRSAIAVPVVDQLKDAVKAKLHEVLTGIVSSLLNVYKNMEVYKACKNGVAGVSQLDPADSLEGLGFNNKDAALVVEVPTFHFNAKTDSLSRDDIEMKHSIYFGRRLSDDSSDLRGKSHVCYAYTSSGGVYAAKIYYEHEADYKREIFISSIMEHENLIKFINSFELGNSRYAIIMPLYPRCSSDFIGDHAKDGIPTETLQTIARDCFKALKYMHSREYCFIDLKPSNIMMHYGDPGRAILIDYGGVIQNGERLIEITEQYCLDIDRMVAHEGIDWVCLGSSLAELAGVDISSGTRKDVANLVEHHETIERKMKRFIRSCLLDHFLKPIEEALIEMLKTVEIN